jgi:CRP/FNR family transcriptional regulator
MIDSKSKTGVPGCECERQHRPREERQDTASIERDLQRAFGSGSRQLIADRGHEIVTAGVACQYLFQLKSGLACRQRPLSEGRQAVLDVYQPGDFVGLDSLFFSPPLDTVLALTKVSYSALGRATVNRLMQAPRIALQLMRHMAEEKQRVDMIGILLGHLKARERTAALLLFLWRRLVPALGRAATAENDGLPFTQKQLAEYLGLDVIHLNRVLGGLRNSGALQFRKGVIIVKDVTQLKQIAGAHGLSYGRPPNAIEGPAAPMLARTS